MTTTLCAKSDLPPRDCAHCRRENVDGVVSIGPVDRLPRQPKPGDVHLDGLYAAQRPARCHWCNETIEVGEPMGWSPERAAAICGRCLA